MPKRAFQKMTARIDFDALKLAMLRAGIGSTQELCRRSHVHSNTMTCARKNPISLSVILVLGKCLDVSADTLVLQPHRKTR